MSDLLELLFELLIDGAGCVMEKASGKAEGKSGAAYWITVAMGILISLAVTVYFAVQAYFAWLSGEPLKLWLYGGGLVLVAAVLLFLGLRRFLRWRRIRAERMYDPRYQK